MSIWSDIHRKSNGDSISKEDFSQIYNPDIEGDEVLDTDEYKGNQYMIYTTGSYPYIVIMMKQEISVFSGYQLVKLKRSDGKYYDMERVAADGKVGFTYFCNNKDDYVEDDHDGKKYGLSELKSMAEEFIDLILDCESDFMKNS